LVYGRRDKLVDPKAAHRATKEFQEAHVMVIPDSGHVAQMEHPELVDRWWREFLG
jgi:pimeloyl-ACP methyl ester carboxylesterase